MKRFSLYFLCVISLLTLMGLCLAGCGIPQEVQTELNQLRTEYEQLKSDKTQWESKKAELEQKIATLEKQAGSVTEKALRDPTYAEVVAFLKSDKTEEEIKQDFTLATVLVAENAVEQGINSYHVIARCKGTMGGMGLHLVGFKTTDKGWVYFCTASKCADSEIKLEIGERLSKSNPSTEITSYFDDTVLSIHYLRPYIP